MPPTGPRQPPADPRRPAEATERRRQLRGLLLLATLCLLLSLLRAGGLGLFHPGWWRLW